MKKNQMKFRLILMLLSVITIVGLSECGQRENATNKEPAIETVMQTAETPAVVTDTLALASTTKDTLKIAGNKTQSVTVAAMKETKPVNKAAATPPVVADKKNIPITSTTPAGNTAIAPPVIKATEPAKPAPAAQPKPVEISKPVSVVVPAPAQNNWVVPAKYKTMANPYPVNGESMALGKSLFGRHCQSCHGNKGDGNGTKAASLDTKISSFHSAGFLAQKPGEVYFKTSVGRKDMPKFEKKIPDEEERWALVHYIMNM